MTPGHLQAEWARLLLGSLADAGVTDVVISPGSRSTPFVLAAARDSRLRLFDVIDERSAAFFALGQARVTGRPSLLIATSGTAGANYFPAVVEAGASHTPLLVLTADRPFELAACGANQTIDQVKLFGDQARGFFDLGAAESAPRALRALRRVAAQAVFATTYPQAGAVHLNARARKPLEPGAGTTKADDQLTERIDALLARRIVTPRAPRRMPEPAAIEELAKACASSSRGLIVCGPAPLVQAGCRSLIAELARRTGYPVLREAASQVRFCGELDEDELTVVDGFDRILRGRPPEGLEEAELVLQIGGAPTAAAWGGYLASQDRCRHWVLGGDAWIDAESTACELLFGDLDLILARLTTRLPVRATPSDWSHGWRRAELLVREAIREELEDPEVGLSEGGVARSLVRALPAGSLLALGNSLPIRHVNTFARGTGADLRVGSQRGASGIDGVVSGVLGAATRWRHLVALLVGDLSFLHDLSGLQAARHATVPVVVVVLQNRGGRIFEQLPLASHPAAGGDLFEHWTTPHHLSLAPAAELHGLGYARVDSPDELEEALGTALGRPGVTVVEAVVPPHGASEQSRRLAARLADASEGASEA